MQNISRRTALKLAGVAAVGKARGDSPAAISIFDGKTLDGWLQLENSATMLSSAGMTDAFLAKLASGPDAVSQFLRGQLSDSAKAGLASYSASNPDAKTILAALVKD